MKLSFDRLFIDVTYTQAQTGSIGVTRVVRRLLDEFRQAPRLSTFAVTAHSAGFREATLPPPAPASSPAPAAGRSLRWVTAGPVRNLVLACLPIAVQHAIWRRYSRWMFNALSRQAPRVAFRPGDAVFMADASWHYEAWPAARQAREAGARVVLMVHDLIPLRHPEYCAPLVSRVFSQWLTHMMPNVDAVVCNSMATERDLRAYCASSGLALPPTGHIRLGCDPQSAQTLPAVTRPALAEFLGRPGACFAAVGSIEPRKNYAWLLGVFERLWAKGHDVRLLIAGRPTADCRNFIERLKQHPAQGSRLLTVFDATDQELDGIYARARALVFPSLAEGFGLPLVEARTRGCPVIASDLPVFHELADAGVSLYAKESIEGLEALVLAHAAQDRRSALQPMPAFTWRDSAEQLLKTVNMVLDTQQPQRVESTCSPFNPSPGF